MTFQPDLSALVTEDIEQHLLGCILMHPEVFHSVQGKVRPEHFYNPVHARIFSRISSHVDEGRIPDAMTLKPFFETDEDLVEVGRLELEHSRYTFPGSFGSEGSPSLEQVTTAGPYFRDFGSDDP